MPNPTTPIHVLISGDENGTHMHFSWTGQPRHRITKFQLTICITDACIDMNDMILAEIVHLKNHIRLIHTIKDMPPSAISNDRAHKWRNIP